MRIVAGPAASDCGAKSERVTVSVSGCVATWATCVTFAASISTSPNPSSAACKVMVVVGFSMRTLISARPRNVAFARSGANHKL